MLCAVVVIVVSHVDLTALLLRALRTQPAASLSPSLTPPTHTHTHTRKQSTAMCCCCNCCLLFICNANLSWRTSEAIAVAYTQINMRMYVCKYICKYVCECVFVYSGHLCALKCLLVHFDA